VLFDDGGNVERRKAIWVDERKEFDSLNFIVRSLSKNEQYSNYYISYSFDFEGNLIQTWSSLNHYKWEFALSDVNQTDSSNHSVKFILADGRIVKELDQYHGVYSNYSYEQSGKLTAKKTFSIEADSLREEWTYIYNDNQLSKAQYFFKNKLIVSHKYSNDGLPDSTILDDGTVYRHKYFYF
jgi:hypothetical protein